MVKILAHVITDYRAPRYEDANQVMEALKLEFGVWYGPQHQINIPQYWKLKFIIKIHCCMLFSVCCKRVTSERFIKKISRRQKTDERTSVHNAVFFTEIT